MQLLATVSYTKLVATGRLSTQAGYAKGASYAIAEIVANPDSHVVRNAFAFSGGNVMGTIDSSVFRNGVAGVQNSVFASTVASVGRNAQSSSLASLSVYFDSVVMQYATSFGSIYGSSDACVVRAAYASPITTISALTLPSVQRVSNSASNGYVVGAAFAGVSRAALSSVSSSAYGYAKGYVPWISAAPVPVPNALFSACTLLDGRVFICGGFLNGPSASSYIYDPSTNTWSSVAAMPVATREYALAVLSDGRVFVCGGVINFHGDRTASTYIYNPMTNVWSSVASLPKALDRHCAASLGDGRILVTGGTDDTTPFNLMSYVYNISLDTWSTVASYQSFVGNLINACCVRLQNGKVFVLDLYSCFIYDKTLDTWTAAAACPSILNKSICTLLQDGRVFVCGGYSYSSGQITSSSYIYNPATDAWSSATSMKTAIYSHAAATMLDGRVFVCGGSTSSVITSDAHIYEVYPA